MANKISSDVVKSLIELNTKTVNWVIDKEKLYDIELDYLKKDDNFLEFRKFISKLEAETNILEHIQKTDALYELYSVQHYFHNNRNANNIKKIEVKYNSALEKLSLFVDSEELIPQEVYDDVSWDVTHRTDYVSKKKQIVFESKNYSNISSISKFIRDVYCYSLFCAKRTGKKYKGILLIRNKPESMRDDTKNVTVLGHQQIEVRKIA